MKNTSKTVVFFGSGPVAADSLRFLAGSFNVTTVVTKPAAPHHYGTVPVIDLSQELGLQLFTPRIAWPLRHSLNRGPLLQT